MSLCKADGCTKPAAAKGYCLLHYHRWRRHGNPLIAHRMCPRHASVAERLALVLDRSGGPDGCWPFTGAVNGNGYGRMQIAGVTKGVHVWAYEEAFGPVPDGLIVRHKCDNPICGNPAHLEVGTHQDNMDDKVERGRQSHMCGEQAPTAILTAPQVLEIRKLRRQDARVVDIASQFGVSCGTVYAIISGKRWRHLIEAVEDSSPSAIVIEDGQVAA